MKKSLLLVNFLPPSFRYDWPGKIPVTEWLAGSQQEVIMNKKTNKTKKQIKYIKNNMPMPELHTAPALSRFAAFFVHKKAYH